MWYTIKCFVCLHGLSKIFVKRGFVMKVSKLLVSGLLCGTLLASPAAKANLLADIGKCFLIGTGIYVAYRTVNAIADATESEEFQGTVRKVGGSATNALNAVVGFGGTVAKSAGDAAALGVEKLAGVIKGEKNLDKNLTKNEAKNSDGFKTIQ